MGRLIDEDILRRELAKLEREGLAMPSAENEHKLQLPPVSARREIGYPVMPDEEKDRLRTLIKQFGLELINDGAVYRVKRQRDFTIWTLAASPLTSEERGGGEAHALLETVRRFCD